MRTPLIEFPQDLRTNGLPRDSLNVPLGNLPGSPLQFFGPSYSDGIVRFFQARQQILSDSSALLSREPQDLG